MTTLGRRIMELRRQDNISRRELAKSLGITYWALSKYESGERCPDQDLLRSLAFFFKVSTDYLLGVTEDSRTFGEVAQGTQSFDEQIEALLDMDPSLTLDEKKSLLEDLKNYFEFTRKRILEKRDHRDNK